MFSLVPRAQASSCCGQQVTSRHTHVMQHKIFVRTYMYMYMCSYVHCNVVYLNVRTVACVLCHVHVHSSYTGSCIFTGTCMYMYMHIYTCMGNISVEHQQLQFTGNIEFHKL